MGARLSPLSREELGRVRILTIVYETQSVRYPDDSRDRYPKDPKSKDYCDYNDYRSPQTRCVIIPIFVDDVATRYEPGRERTN
jgi:hypothetical protein